MKKRKQATEVMRYQVVHLSRTILEKEQEYENNLNRMQLLDFYNDVATIICYDHGYPQVSKGTQMATWEKNIDEGYKKGQLIHPLIAINKGSVSIAEQVKKANPGYIHELYRYVQNKLPIKCK